METTVWVAIIVALSTLFASLGATFLNLRLNKKLMIELGRAIDVDQRTRRWQVRSEPLLRLRAELAQMATKAARVAKPGKNLAIPLEKTDEDESEALGQAIRDWNEYILRDDFDMALNVQDDEGIVKLAKEIRNEYLDTYAAIVSGELFGKDMFKERRAAEEKIAPKVTKVQALINDRLEKL